jgi:hypothetical protein
VRLCEYLRSPRAVTQQLGRNYGGARAAAPAARLVSSLGRAPVLACNPGLISTVGTSNGVEVPSSQ